MRPPRNFYAQTFKRDAGMLSRVADSLYWMGRYLERAEHTSRLVNVGIATLARSISGTRRRPLEISVGSVARSRCGRSGRSDATSQCLVFSRANGSSIVSCVAAARENLRHVREQCSTRMWEQLNRLYLDVIERAPRRRVDPAVSRLLPLRPRGRVSVPRHHRCNHEPRRRLAIHPARPLRGACRHADDASRNTLPAHDQQSRRSRGKRRNTWNGLGFLAVASLWRLTAKRTRRRSDRYASPNSCCSIRSFRIRSASPSIASTLLFI